MSTSIAEAFESQVRKTPHCVAVRDESKGLTYEELDALSNDIAASFPGAPRCIGLVMDHGIEMIASILAILKVGAAYIPAEANFPRARIRFMMEQTQASFIVTQSHYAEALSGHSLMLVDSGRMGDERGNDSSASAPSVTVSGAIDAEADASVRATDAFAARSSTSAVAPDAPAYVLYTSGTTGVPKGVVIEQVNVLHYVKAFSKEFKPGPGDVMLQYSVCTFDIFVEEVFPILLSGGTLAIPDSHTRNDFPALLDFIEKHQVTMMSGFPYLILEMNKLSALPASLRLLISGGDVLRESYVDNLLGKVDVYNTYGPSETTVCASYYRCKGGDALEDGTYPVGKEVSGARIEVVGKDGVPVPAGEVGEICIYGGGVSRGYLDESLNAAAFGVTAEGERFYRSGDLARRLPDGNLAFLERKDQQVMILGKRVEPQEIENVLSQCPGVEQGVVIPEIDESGLAYLTAFIVPQNGKVSASGLRECLSEYLPEYMIPEFFVSLGNLPMTESGKIDRRALPTVLKEGGL